MAVSFSREAFDSTTASMMASDLSISDTDLDDLERRSLLQALPERNKGQSKRYRLQPRLQGYLQKRKIDLIQQSLEITREIGDRRGEANLLNSLGGAYHSLEQYPQVIECYQQSLKIQHEVGDRHSEKVSLYRKGSALMDMGNALLKNGRQSEALQSFQQALAIFEKLKFKDMIEKCKTDIQNQRRKWWQRW